MYCQIYRQTVYHRTKYSDFLPLRAVLKHIPALLALPALSILAGKPDKTNRWPFNGAFTVQNVPSWGYLQ